MTNVVISVATNDFSLSLVLACYYFFVKNITPCYLGVNNDK